MKIAVVVALCFLMALVKSQAPPAQTSTPTTTPPVFAFGPPLPGKDNPIPVPAVIPGIINPSLNPFVTGPLNHLMASPIFNMALLAPSALLPPGRRANHWMVKRGDVVVEKGTLQCLLLKS